MAEKGKKSGGVSRRKFLRDSGLIVGGAATLGIGGLALTGCSIAPNCAGADGTNPAAGASPQLETEYFGECICPSCGNIQPHPRGVPCRMLSCPKCGTGMARGEI